jgi:MoaA/NifB/PqqE/SkfB family radical SAM enzyme
MAVAWIGFHLTDRCQLDCQHCLRDPARAPKDLALPIIRKVLAEARAVYHAAQIALTGGEPTLHPEFEAVIDAIVEHGFTWHMVTNARRFERVVESLRRVPARRAALTAVDFSIDGADEATHDAIRGQGSYRDVMLGATLCTAYQIPFVLQMVVNRKNAHQIEAMGMLAATLQARAASFSFLQATGTPADDELFLSTREWQGVTDRIDRLREMLKIPVRTPEGFRDERPFHVCEPWASQQLHIDVEGRLNLCCQHSGVPSEHPGDVAPDVAGDLREMSLAEAHARLLDIIHAAQKARLAHIARLDENPLDEWDSFPCNACMKHFGKPHWDAEGAAGPGARRERWRGAWSKRKLPLVG